MRKGNNSSRSATLGSMAASFCSAVMDNRDGKGDEGSGSSAGGLTEVLCKVLHSLSAVIDFILMDCPIEGKRNFEVLKEMS